MISAFTGLLHTADAITLTEPPRLRVAGSGLAGMSASRPFLGLFFSASVSGTNDDARDSYSRVIVRYDPNYAKNAVWIERNRQFSRARPAPKNETFGEDNSKNKNNESDHFVARRHYILQCVANCPST
jgi:hypothetical protein